MTSSKLVTRSKAIVLLWMHGHSLAEIGELFDLSEDRLRMILRAITSTQGRPSQMPLEEWRDKLTVVRDRILLDKAMLGSDDGEST